MADEKPAIVIADCEPAIVSALSNFAYLTLQRHLGFPCETFSDQSDSIANFETIFQVKIESSAAFKDDSGSASRGNETRPLS